MDAAEATNLLPSHYAEQDSPPRTLIWTENEREKASVETPGRFIEGTISV